LEGKDRKIQEQAVLKNAVYVKPSDALANTKERKKPVCKHTPAFPGETVHYRRSCKTVLDDMTESEVAEEYSCSNINP
jgi:hypothetical protein